MIHPSAIIDNNVKIENNVSVWHFAHVRQGAHLEEGVSLGKDVYIDKDVRVGRYSRIQNGVSVYQGVQISSHCFIGPHVIFTNDNSPRVGLKKWNRVNTNLRTGMSIGAGAIIRCGVTIGEFAMVGAGAVVTKDIPPFHLAVGLPAEIKNKICACGQTFFDLNEPVRNLISKCCESQLESGVLSLAMEWISKNA